ncbi:hypothetical protein [Neobacillus niacini]|uniref:hypothetical protein n=1 Tax=Neobacillus niacini TaxID=86668 RepID=UPI003000BA5A
MQERYKEGYPNKRYSLLIKRLIKSVDKLIKRLIKPAKALVLLLLKTNQTFD